jgi:transcriptional regulator with XRE-family HTH domain
MTKTSQFEGDMSVKLTLNRYNINQTELCKKLNFSREAFSKVVNGHRNLSVGKAKLIADLYGFDWREFYETAAERYISATGCIDDITVRKTYTNYLVEVPREWQENSQFYAICTKGKAYHEYVYVFTSTPIPFDVTKIISNTSLFTLKNGVQYIGYINGYVDPFGKDLMIGNYQTYAEVIVPAKKIVTMQKGRALLTPNPIRL